MRNKIYFFLGISFICGFISVYADTAKTPFPSRLEEKHSERLVYLAPFKDLSSSGMDTGFLEKIMAEYLMNRKSPRFIVEKQPKSANLIIGVNILEYRCSKKNPSNTISGNSSRLLIDALIEENQAFLKARFMVRNQKGFLLWKGTLQSHFIQNNMTSEEAQAKVFKKVCRLFIKKCFGKNSPLSR